MSLTKHLSDLADILGRNIELYDEMALEMEAERAALQTHSLMRINEALRRKEAVVLKIRTLEETRQRVMEGVAAATGLDPELLTFIKLVKLASEPLKDRLQAIASKLRAAIEKTNELNHFNRGLIDRMIKLNYDAASHLQNLIDPDTTYARHGGTASPLKAGRVVEQVM